MSQESDADREIRLVTEATKAATQEVAKKNRHRLMYSGLIVGLIIGGVVGGLVGSYVSREHAAQTRSLARENSLKNCRSQAASRPQGNARGFGQIVFFGLLQDAINARSKNNAQAKAFAHAELARINALAHGKVEAQPRWRYYTAIRDEQGRIIGNELPQKITSFAQLAGAIHPVPPLDCRHLVNG